MTQDPHVDGLDSKLRLALEQPRPDPDGWDRGQAAGYGAEEPHLHDYVKVLYRRRWLAATAFTVIVLAVAVYTFTATPVYEATAKLLIEAENPNVVTFKEVLAEGQGRQDYYQTQYNILLSRSLARKTLDALHLWNDPELGGPTPDEGFSLTGWIRAGFSSAAEFVASSFRSDASSTRRAQGSSPASPSGVAQGFSPAGAADAETLAQSRAIDAFLGKLEVAPVRNSRIVDLRFRSLDPALAARVANAHARNYIEQSLEFKFLASKEASDWLGERLAEQRRQVESAEVALQRYREEHGAVSMAGRENIVVQQLGDLNAAVTRARTGRLEKEALYRQLQAIQNNRVALDTFPAIQANSFIQQLKAELARLQRELSELSEQLGDRHPDILRVRSAIQTAETRLQGEIGKVVQSVRNEFLAAQAQENSLAAALDQQKRDALAMNRVAIEYAVLEREVESSRQVYESLLQRAKETGVSTELRTSNIRIVDQAERPRGPVSPRRDLNLLLALFGGGMFAIGLAFFFEYLDDRIKTPDEIKAHLGLPFLGLIPLVSGKDLPDTPFLNNGMPANFGEALRTVRTNVLFSSAGDGTRSLVVTSTGPGEGKSVVAGNLAIALAQAGQRVLLIDADLRRQCLHEVFGLTAEPGLSNLMVGNAKASEVIRKTSVPGLWLLPAGRVAPNPSELLGSQRFRDFLATLDDHFDWIIADSPPVLPVADASVIAHAVSGVLFVVGAEMPSRHAAQAALEQLEGARARIVGAVLNRVDLTRNAYYYSQYYRREYSQYYVKSS